MALHDGLSPAQIGLTLQIAMPTELRNSHNKAGLCGMREVCRRLHTETA